jgi:selenium metabolism protein YedF
MTKTVDARGLACPRPVILTRNALKETSHVMTIVDNEAAKHNVTRMAEKTGHNVEVEEREDGTYIAISVPDTDVQETTPETEAATVVPASPSGPPVLFVSSEFMGRGAHDELGNVLIRGFFHTLGEVEPVPDTIVFINSGVKLTVEGSPVLEDLQALSERGVEILACGTCLSYYEIMEKLAVGEVSNMYSIAETLLNAGKVVNL